MDKKNLALFGENRAKKFWHPCPSPTYPNHQKRCFSIFFDSRRASPHLALGWPPNGGDAAQTSRRKITFPSRKDHPGNPPNPTIPNPPTHPPSNPPPPEGRGQHRCSVNQCSTRNRLCPSSGLPSNRNGFSQVQELRAVEL